MISSNLAIGWRAYLEGKAQAQAEVWFEVGVKLSLSDEAEVERTNERS